MGSYMAAVFCHYLTGWQLVNNEAIALCHYFPRMAAG